MRLDLEEHEPTLTTAQAQARMLEDPAAPYCLVRAEDGMYLALNLGVSDGGQELRLEVIARIID